MIVTAAVMNQENHFRWPSPLSTGSVRAVLFEIFLVLCLTLASTSAQDSTTASDPKPADTKAPSDSKSSASDAKPAENSSAPASTNTSQPRPWDILSDAAHNKNSMRRAEAIAALGTAGTQRRVVRLVERALDDSDPSIRELAAKTLGEMRARSSIPKLTRALDDDSAEVSFAAAKSLWTMGNRAGRDVFLQILAGEKSSPGGLIKNELQATRRRFQDPKALAMNGAKEAATSLFGPAGWGIKVMEELTQDRSASARAMSAILLGPNATPDTLRELQDALNDKNWIVRAAAAQALGVSRHREQIPILQPLLQDTKPAVRCMAAAAILRLSAGAASVPAGPATSASADVRPALDPSAQKSFK
jgi:HEAT repeat protein